MRKSLPFLIPLFVFAGLAWLLFFGLHTDPRRVPSPLIGKAAPQFTLPALDDPSTTVSNANLKGKVSLVNVWATWCVSCRAEHQELMRLAKLDGIQILGLNYKDDRNDAMRWLETYGNPYVVNAFDADGRVGIDWGVYGTPETFLVDQDGIIRYKQIGPIDQQAWEKTLRPMIEKLKARS
ncbi:MAG: DsbE family thiol:disulfide interchange protein [Chromatiaceae bacterium]|jgi:cytochrome c biogenesis protein CcmG, thiol:disulfide interchange protein DsbE